MDFTQCVAVVILAFSVVIVPATSQQFASKPQGYAVMQGTNITLKCKVSKLGAKNVIWSRGVAFISMNHMIIGGDVDRMKITGKYNLNILNVTQEDEGEYVCQVTSTPPLMQTSFINITVPSTVEMLNKTVDIEATLKDNVTLTCAATGKPKPTIVWSREDATLPGGKKEMKGDTLTLTGLKYSHGGVYKCTAFNGVGEPDEDSVRVDVFYPPTIHTKSKTLHTGPGFSAKIPCIASGQPKPSIEWRHNDTVINLRDLPENKKMLLVEKGFKIDYSLEIKGIKDSDLGSYSCRVTNNKGSDTVKIIVTALPGKVEISSPAAGNFSTVYSLTWSVTSPVKPETYKLMYREMNETFEGEWTEVDVPAMSKDGVITHTQSHSLMDLAPDTKYEVLLRAYNSYGWGEVSDKFMFTTNEPGFTPPPTTRPPPVRTHSSEERVYDDSTTDGAQLIVWHPMTFLFMVACALMSAVP
ncbi:limbic system-associated membrane protein-like isoform X1 [Haliotis cracherodii]|uniref:limbic system-associated membrane protein-like isoform X1 n=1 Tax=Haliotis cracherodii TaxID=6455 RepID=UPI0039E7E37F